MPVNLRTVNQRDTQKKIMLEIAVKETATFSIRMLSLIKDSKSLIFKRRPSLRYQRNMIVQGSVQESLWAKIRWEERSSERYPGSWEIASKYFYAYYINTISSYHFWPFQVSHSFTHSFTLSFSYQAFTEYLLCVRLCGCSLVKWSCWKCCCVGFSRKRKAGMGRCQSEVQVSER